MKKYILAIDQGTTRTKSALFDDHARLRGFGSAEVSRSYPKPGWVEQDPSQVWNSVLVATRIAMRNARCHPKEIVAVGLDNQGETVVAWNKKSGHPIYNAIVWQCRRTSETCDRLKARKDYARVVRAKTGLLIDPYFSATKMRWLIDHTKHGSKLAKSGDLLLGTSDAYLVWNMTGARAFITDYATGSRTLLLNIHKLTWDEELIHQFRLSREYLPDLVENSGHLAQTAPDSFFGIDAPISGLIVDQQAALFGHGCLGEGEMKNTYGTGCFALMNIGRRPKLSRHGLLTTVAWVLNRERAYALDGGVYTAGSAIDWLANSLGIIKEPAQTSEMASSIQSNDGVFLVPAFVGLAAPYWDSSARGTIVGMTDRTTKANIVRATLESIAYQVEGVLRCMEADSRLRIRKLRVDGGPTANRFLMQFQADILGVPVEVPKIGEVTGRGTALLAGLGVNFWDDTSQLADSGAKVTYRPRISSSERNGLLSHWKRAVARSRRWYT